MTRRRGRFIWSDTGGDELHRVGRWLWTGTEPPGLADFQMSGQRAELGFWSELERIADACDRMLAEGGFPPADLAVRFSETGLWCLAEGMPGRSPPGVRIHFVNNGAAYAERFAAPFTDLWFAGDLGFKCRRVLAARDCLEEQDLMEILQIGMALQSWEWRRKFKPSILTGRKQRKVLADHRGTANAKRQHGTKARREAITRMLRDTSLTRGALEKHLQRRLEAEAGIAASFRTIRRDLKELRGR